MDAFTRGCRLSAAQLLLEALLHVAWILSTPAPLPSGVHPGTCTPGQAAPASVPSPMHTGPGVSTPGGRQGGPLESS